MIVSYDSLAEAVYIKLKPEGKVHETLEFAPETFADLDENGDLIGVELLNPGVLVLKRLAKHFHRPELAKIDPSKLQEAVPS